MSIKFVGQHVLLADLNSGEMTDADSQPVNIYHYPTQAQTGRSQGMNELLKEETTDISKPTPKPRELSMER